MTNKAYVEEEIIRLERMDKDHHALSKVARNLNRLALSGDLAPVFNREAEVEAIQKLLLRRTKPNALLIGPAGCGKTAIAEALAAHIAAQRIAWMQAAAQAETVYFCKLDEWRKNDCVGACPVFKNPAKPPLCDVVIYDLSMNALLSGTKYRGEFEEKIQNIMDICRDNRDIVLFIDEIHQMNEIGGSDGASGMGQILKPALARAEIRCIGATTTEESVILKKDKALARRFSDVTIKPLAGEAAIDTANSILRDYEKFHSISVTGTPAAAILEMVNLHVGGVFPNNFIDVIDETLSGARFEGKTSVSLSEIKATLSRMTGNIIQ